MNYNKNGKISKEIFEPLNGLRGFLAFIVLMSHSSNDFGLGCDYILFIGAGYYVGVIGFFVLSAFLLTHRLIVDLENTQNIKESVFVCIKYMIRRFFRIFIPFFIYCMILKSNQSIIGGNYTKFSSFFELVTMQTVGNNHLWTIPNEVKYYFFLPIFSISYVKLHKIAYISSLIGAFTIIQLFNLLQLTDEHHSLNNRHLLRPRFLIFLSGSIAAMVYQQIHKNVNGLHSKIFNFINICLIIYFPYKFLPYLNEKVSFLEDSSYCGIFISIFILLMVLGPSHSVVGNYLNSSKLLRMYGQCSFGIYLFHPSVIPLIKTFIKTRLSIEIIIIVNVFSFIIGFLFYFLIEKPSIKVGNYLINMTRI